MKQNKDPEGANLLLLSGLYSRVARQLGVHPSYVSRVARGERRSDKIYRAIADELARVSGPSSRRGEKVTPEQPDAAAQLRLKGDLTRQLQRDARVRKTGAQIVDLEPRQNQPAKAKLPLRKVSRTELTDRIAANASLIASVLGPFERLSNRLDRFRHVLSLVDADGIVLYSFGTVRMLRSEGRSPGSDWSNDKRGLSAAARALSAGVPVVITGGGALPGVLTPAIRMACPIRLSDSRTVAVIVLTIEANHAKADHLLAICQMSRQVCALYEREVKRASQQRSANNTRKKAQPSGDEEARHLAFVIAMPQISREARAALASALATIEERKRQAHDKAPDQTDGQEH
jgi:hypothetical protein